MFLLSRLNPLVQRGIEEVICVLFVSLLEPIFLVLLYETFMLIYFNYMSLRMILSLFHLLIFKNVLSHYKY